jgi:AcrR family transcriptional regulator
VTQTKERILDRTAELFRRYGYNGTGLKRVVEEANAPFGSIYHFFPGGKEQLGEEVIDRAAGMYQELVEAVFEDAPDVVQGTRDVFLGAAVVLRETDYADACPIATVALEVASVNEPLRRATARAFDSWIEGCTSRLRAEGIPEERARELSFSIVGALEGAFVLSRALRTTEALEVEGERLAGAVEAALAEAGL